MSPSMEELAVEFPLQGRWIFLIGHRGVGKSTILQQIGILFPNTITLDLDRELVDLHGPSIFNLLPHKEMQFRLLERQVFLQTLEQYDQEGKTFVVSVGGGYTGGFPHHSEVIWLRRRTDNRGRIFLDRPRLSDTLTPLEEFETRRAEREPRFRELSSYTWVLREGAFEWGPIEHQLSSAFLESEPLAVGGFTVVPADVGVKRESWIERTLRFGPERIELRDDLVPLEEILRSVSLGVAPHAPQSGIIEPAKTLISFRRSRGQAEEFLTLCHQLGLEWGTSLEDNKLIFDWPAEWGPCPNNVEPAIISWHGSFNEFEKIGRQVLDHLSQTHPGAHLKATVSTESLDELIELHQWWHVQPERRSLLPMSENGRWVWYRQWASRTQRIQFWQPGLDAVPDQPTLSEWLAVKSIDPFSGRWAAVLGDPVEHSWTPSFHGSYFMKKRAYVTAVHLNKSEFNSNNLDFLHGLGLYWAAVTAPLKSLAFELAQRRTDSAHTYYACNTLCWNSESSDVFGAFTDPEGLAVLKQSLPEGKKIAVWGGGGLKPLLQAAFPNASFFSARTGCDETGTNAELFDPSLDVIIWATGWFSELHFPPTQWSVKTILDLNYSEASPGRHLASERQIQYVSGKDMFFAQARAQQMFWDAFEV